MVDKIFVLNLRERVDRREGLTSLLKKHKMFDITEWVYGIHGQHLVYEPNPRNVLAEYNFMYHWEVNPDTRFKSDFEHYKKQNLIATRNELAVSLGHIKMWRSFLKSKAESALFLEDDAMFGKGIKKKITSIMKDLPEDWDMVYLSAYRSPFGGYDTVEYSDNLDRLNFGVFWLSGYLLSKKGAKKLLRKRPVKGPVDVWINHQFKDMNVFIASGDLPISQSDNFGDSNNNYSWESRFWT
jgi:GR25 family glycosyltransferase involved in LPS biosynthesis